MFRPAKQSDVKFFRYTLTTPYLASPLDGGLVQCTRSRGENILFDVRGRDANQRYLMPLAPDDVESEVEEIE